MKSIATACILTIGLTLAHAQTTKVKVETKEVVFDAPPQMVRGVTMVPVRNMVDAMAGTMRWNLEQRTVSIWKGNRRIDLALDSRQAIVNGKTVNMEEASYMHKGRIYVPLKFVAESTGYIISSESGFFVLRATR